MLPALFAAGISLFGAACAPEDMEVAPDELELGSVQEPLYVASGLTWRNKVIPVCWETTGNDTEKGWVRNAVVETWQRYTGVSFTGWGTCSGSTPSGIRIATADGWPATQGLGTQLDGVPSGMLLNFWYNFTVTDADGVVTQPFAGCTGAAREGCIRSIGVHEFGHALGFAHEQNRGDTPSTCTQAPQGGNGDVTYGSWDLTSVMNYCNPSYNNNGKLSKGDVTGAVQVYGLPSSGAVCKGSSGEYTRTATSCGDVTSQARCNSGDTEISFTVTEGAFTCGPPRDRFPISKITRKCTAVAYYPCDRPRIASLARTGTSLDLFTVGQDGRVYTSWAAAGGAWSGAANNWRAIGGFFPLSAPITAVARNASTMDLFVIGNDGRVYTSWWAAGSDWSGVNDNWRSLGGFFPPGAQLSAVARTQNNLDLFVTGYDGKVYTSWWAAGSDWSGVNNNWRALGGYFPAGTPVAAVARTANNIDLFVMGGDGKVYTSWWAAGSDWSGVNNNWLALGGYFPQGSTVAATARSASNLDLFITGYDGRVYTSWWTPAGGWSGVGNNWVALGGYFPQGAAPTVVSRSVNNLDLFITGADGRVYTSWWTPATGWSGVGNNWLALGGSFPPASPVTAMARTSGNLDLFVLSGDRTVYTSWWSAAAGWSSATWTGIGGFF